MTKLHILPLLILALLSGLGSSVHSFPVAVSSEDSGSTLSEVSYNLALASEEVQSVPVLKIQSGKLYGNSGVISVFTAHSSFPAGFSSAKKASAHFNIRQDLLEQQIFPFHIFW